MASMIGGVYTPGHTRYWDPGEAGEGFWVEPPIQPHQDPGAWAGGIPAAPIPDESQSKEPSDHFDDSGNEPWWAPKFGPGWRPDDVAPAEIPVPGDPSPVPATPEAVEPEDMIPPDSGGFKLPEFDFPEFDFWAPEKKFAEKIFPHGVLPGEEPGKEAPWGNAGIAALILPVLLLTLVMKD